MDGWKEGGRIRGGSGRGREGKEREGKARFRYLSRGPQVPSYATANNVAAILHTFGGIKPTDFTVSATACDL